MFSKTINGWIIVGVVLLLSGLIANSASAVTVFFNDAPKDGAVALGSEETFSFGGWGQDETASANGNEFMVLAAGGNFSGAGIAAHVDVTDPGFGGDGLNVGNVIRLSMWIARAPADPLTVGPNFIDVLKLEFYDLALANPETNPENRILDTDINLGAGTHFEADINTTEWKQFVQTYTVDVFDFPDLSAIEEVRGVIFAGDFANLSDQSGAIFVDNIRMEVFDNEAAVTPLDMTNPGALINTGVVGDYNENDVVDAADYTVWRDNLGSGTALPNDGGLGTPIVPAHYDQWKTNFGMMLPPGAGAGNIGAAAVPEPATLLLAVATLLSSVVLHRPKRTLL